jgi:hypothetical protein
MRRGLFLECLCELAGMSGSHWTEHDQRFGGLITERAMDAMGHIDISFDDQPLMIYAGPRLLVAQPTDKIPMALLVGHRNQDTIDELRRSADDMEIIVDVSQEHDGYPCLPNRVRVTADSPEDLNRLGATIGASFIRDPPADRFVEFAYSLDVYLAGRSWTEEADLNWPRRQYEPDGLFFVGRAPNSGLDLLEFRNPYSMVPSYFLRDGKRTCRINRDWGQYAVLRARGRHVLGYYDYAPKSRRGHLIAPVGAPLPRLFARAAALCSGHPPVFLPKQQVELPPTQEWRGFYLFRDVRHDIATRIAVKLGQELQTARIVGKKGTPNA